MYQQMDSILQMNGKALHERISLGKKLKWYDTVLKKCRSLQLFKDTYMYVQFNH